MRRPHEISRGQALAFSGSLAAYCSFDKPVLGRRDSRDDDGREHTEAEQDERDDETSVTKVDVCRQTAKGAAPFQAL
jgi:hypothetical protein